MPLLRDVRLAFRRIHRHPTFAVAVAGTLGIGIAATTSIYTVVDGVLLKPLPFPDSRALVRVTSDYQALNLKDTGLSQPELEDYRQRSGAFDSAAGIWPVTANLTGSDRPERVEVLLTSANYFDLLGARPALGRTFDERDEVPGIATVAVISDALWRRGFGADPQVLGRKLRIDEDIYEIIGVMPSSFRHPSVTLETEVEVWAPTGWKDAPFSKPAYSARFMPSALARVKTGLTIDEARARVDALGAEMARQHPNDYPARLGWTPRVYPLAEDLTAGVRPALFMVMAGIVFVLLIAISNTSNLLLVRAVERERELAILRALGATRTRIMLTVLVEGTLLAIAGGGAGFLASLWGVDLLMRFVPERLPRVAEVAVDHRVFLFAAVVSIGAGLLVSAGPALQSAQTDVIERLKAAGRGLHSGTRARVRNALVIAQVAIAVVLLCGAGLLMRSLWNLQAVDTGITVDRLVTARVWLPQPNQPETGPFFTHEKRIVLIRGIIERLMTSPDVVHSGMATALPATPDSSIATFAVEGWTPDRQDFASATAVSVTPGYFASLGMRLLRGRLLADSDDRQAPRAVVVNELLARTYFPTEDPVGRRFRFVGRRGQVSTDAPWTTIVGVVADVREDGIDVALRPQMYQSMWQASSLNLAIVASGRTAPPSAAAVAGAVQQADQNLPVYAVRTGESLVAAQLASRRFATFLINAFAVSALLLSAFGLHGVIAYGVRQRTHEIGVRVALGATATRVIALVLGQAARLTIKGVAIGLAIAYVVTHLMTTMLFNIRPADPGTLASVVLLLAVVVGLATFGAARRAARIDPAVALRLD